MIKLSDCKDGYLYRIVARNSSIGIFDERQNGFVILRTKFNDTYLFVELHYEFDIMNGTAKPIEELDKSPFVSEDFEEQHYKKDGLIFHGMPKHKEIANYLRDHMVAVR